MRGYMFRNRWFALLFVCITLAGVTKLIGTDREHGAIQQAAGEIAAQKAQADRLAPPPIEVEAEPAQDVPFADDEELVDAAVGEDPTPPDDFANASADAEEGPADEVTIVSRDASDEAAPAGQQTDQ